MLGEYTRYIFIVACAATGARENVIDVYFVSRVIYRAVLHANINRR